MITKGIIRTIDFSNNTCTVRLPLFETAGNTTEMTIPATFSITPGIYNSYKEGDIVEVAFDNGELQNPVVVGKLYLGVNREAQESRGSANFSDLTVKNSVTLPLDTKFSVDPGSGELVNVKGGNKSVSSINDIIYNIQDLNKQIITQEIQNSGLYLTKNNSGQSSGFGWALNDNSWTLTSYADTRQPIDILKADNTGVSIAGELKLVGYPSETRTRFCYTIPGQPSDDNPAFFKIQKSIEYRDQNNETHTEIRDFYYLNYPITINDLFTGEDGRELTEIEALNKLENDKNWLPLTSLTVNQNYSNLPEFKQNNILWRITYTTTFMPDSTDNNSLKEALVRDSIIIEQIDDGGTGYFTQNGVANDILTKSILIDKTNQNAQNAQKAANNAQKTADEANTKADENSEGIKWLNNDVAVLRQGKSTNYYSSFDPTSEQGGNHEVKEGDCWFEVKDSNKADSYNFYARYNPADKNLYLGGGYYYQNTNSTFTLINTNNINSLQNGQSIFVKKNTLKQWDGEKWVDIGSELVANKVTANYINAMDITAKRIEVLDTNNKTLFLADGINDNKVAIAGFNVNENSISNGTLGDDKSVGVSTGTTINSNSGLYTNFGITDTTLSWGLASGSNFGVTTGGKLYTQSAVIKNAEINTASITSGTITDAEINTVTINNATINSKLEVKNNAGDLIFFKADSRNTDETGAKIEDYQRVQIGGFNVDNTKIYTSTGAGLGNNGTIAIGNNLRISSDSGLATNFINSNLSNSNFYLLTGENFGVTSEGFLYAKGAEINGLFEVKNGNNVLFRADGRENTRGEVQIGQFTINNNRELAITANNSVIKSSTTVAAGKLVIQSKYLNANNSSDAKTDYYAGIDSVTYNSKLTMTGVFGNNITRIFPKQNYSTSESMWSSTNLFYGPVEGNVPIVETSAGQGNIGSFLTTVGKSANVNAILLYDASISSKLSPNLRLIINLTFAWNSSNGYASWILDLQKLKIFNQFKVDSYNQWINKTTAPCVLAAQLTTVDSRLNNMSLYLPGIAGGNNRLGDRNVYSWDGWGFDNLDYNKIGIVTRDADAIDRNINGTNYKCRTAILTVDLYYPAFGNI